MQCAIQMTKAWAIETGVNKNQFDLGQINLSQINLANSLYANTEIPTDMTVLKPNAKNNGQNTPTIMPRGNGKRTMPRTDMKGGSPTRMPRTEPISTPH